MRTLAWAPLLATVALFAFAFSFGRYDASDVSLALAMTASTVVGSLVAARRPGNPIGWLFAATGLCWSVFLAATTSGEIAAALGARELATAAAWVLHIWIVTFALLPLALVLFPNGALPSPRWRGPLGIFAASIAAGFISSTNAIDPGGGIAPVTTTLPFVADIFGDNVGNAARESLQLLSMVGLLGSYVAAAWALGQRLRHAIGIERLQLKWIAYASALLSVAIAMLSLLWLIVDRVDPLSGERVFPIRLFLGIPFDVAFVSVPIAGAVAILRYRLYDIDLVINRTVVYGATTVTLGAIFAAAQLVLQTALRQFTTGNDIAVAASTLLIAALFVPVRRRVQDAVDRRFYRSKYDAARTIAAFSVRLRSEIDLDSLETELVAAATGTMHPRRTWIWLRNTGVIRNAFGTTAE